jgi:hypothetical protein
VRLRAWICGVARTGEQGCCAHLKTGNSWLVNNIHKAEPHPDATLRLQEDYNDEILAGVHCRPYNLECAHLEALDLLPHISQVRLGRLRGRCKPLMLIKETKP